MNRSILVLFTGVLAALTLTSTGHARARGLRWAVSPIYYGYYGGPASSFHNAFHGSMALGFNPQPNGYPPSYFTPNYWNNYDPAGDPEIRAILKIQDPWPHPPRKLRRSPNKVERMHVASKSSKRRHRETAD